MFLPPRPFASPKVEQEFLRDYYHRFAGHRRVAVVIALATWLAYVGWDFFHFQAAGAGFGGEPVLSKILFLRAIGAGWASVISGIVYGVLAWFVRGRSLVALGIAVSCGLEDLRPIATLDLRTDYLRPAAPGLDREEDEGA